MTMNNVGVIITKGPINWQVLQQQNGVADITLEGCHAVEPGIFGKIYARVVREETGECVLPWTKANILNEAQWQVTLRRIPNGSLYRVETGFCPDGQPLLEWMIRGDMIHHLAVGDLYVIAGQSNSAGYGKDMIYDPPELGVHLLRNNGRWDIATHPMNESTDIAHSANLERCNPGHSPWLSFAKMIKRETGIPIGLIQTSLGGSSLDAWLPGNPLYENMLKIIASAGNKLKGILWYQGCSDTSSPQCDTYLQRFCLFINAVRNELKDISLPFITVQLARHTSCDGSNEADRAWSAVRGAQICAAQIIPGVFVIPTIDCQLSDAIHISALSNMAIGERAARIALTRWYGKQIHSDAPMLSSVKLADGSILIKYSNVMQRLYTFESSAGRLPFRIEDEIGILEIRSYNQPQNNEILIQTERQPQGLCLISSYYGKNPQGMPIIDTGSRIPALAFYHAPVESR